MASLHRESTDSLIVIWLGFKAQAVPAADKRWSTMASQWCRLTIISNQGSYSTDTEELSELSVPLIYFSSAKEEGEGGTAGRAPLLPPPPGPPCDIGCKDTDRESLCSHHIAVDPLVWFMSSTVLQLHPHDPLPRSISAWWMTPCGYRI